MLKLIKILLIAVLLLGSCPRVSAQNAAALEVELQQAESPREKLQLHLQLAENYIKLRNQADKAMEHARYARQIAVNLDNPAMAAKSSMLLADAYKRKRDRKGQESALKDVFAYAKQSKDGNLIVKSILERGRIAERDRNYRRASEIYEDGFNYLSQSGNSLSDLEAVYERQEIVLDREKRRLIQEIEALRNQTSTLGSERDQLSSEKEALTERQQELLEETEKKEQLISAKEEELASAAEKAAARKAEADALLKRKEKQVKSLTRKALEEQAAADAARAETAEAEIARQQATIETQKAHQQRNLLLIGAVGVGLLTLLMIVLYSSIRRAKRKVETKNKELADERERSEELLLNILPPDIAHELKDNKKVVAKKYNEVTVLFSDFVNFTSISEKLSPEELVAEIDTCFKGFDFILQQYPDIEKIKTIGDAYMCASGLSSRQVSPSSIVRAAMDMQEFLEDLKQERQRLGKLFFEARIGIHTGPVVAGVVGVKKFAYDIWGDTVNTAARVEGKGQPGRVNISEDTYRKVKYQFACEYRGKVEAKNKGLIEMYFVERELQPTSV